MLIKRELLLFKTGVNCETAFSPAVKRDLRTPPPLPPCVVIENQNIILIVIIHLYVFPMRERHNN